jgi:selenobiotic family peptide radical SAM maturase
MPRRRLQKILRHCPACLRFLDENPGRPAAGAFAATTEPRDIPLILSAMAAELSLPPFLPALARLELLIHRVDSAPAIPRNDAGLFLVNPTLQTIELKWRNLLGRTELASDDRGAAPEPGREIVFLWRQPGGGKLAGRVAGDEELLVLKIIMEGLTVEDVAAAGNIPVGAVEQALKRAAGRGFVLAPASRLGRDQVVFPDDCGVDRDRFRTAAAFTLQWHLTQACDLHCRHCYDRSSRASLGLAEALAVLDEVRDFCRSRHVRGNITFTGGNPLLHAHFFELYRAAGDRNLNVVILGNPTTRSILERLRRMQPAVHYQVSLEGLPEHNDYIRGKGHFAGAIAFLELLRELGIFSMVMLTLTRDNLEQVLPLAEMLRGKVDSFTFNRLAMVGEGANLHSVAPDDFRTFLPKFLAAAKDNPAIRLKDNLFNIIRHQEGRELFRGCAGYGCGAAFSFLTLLSDGEVHACRKFPSPVGNILNQGLAEIYDSAAAQRYRHGSAACRGCAIRPACGGCQAVVHGMGLDPGKDRDPYCFINS